MEQAVLPLGNDVVVADASDEVLNPFDDSVVAVVPACDATHVDLACAAAGGALERGLAQFERAEILERAAALMRHRIQEFASTIALEAGKPLVTAQVEAERCADTLAFSAAEARKLSGHVVPLDAARAASGRIGFTVTEPVGVVAAITPFNFPLNLVAHKVAPAIAAGCPVVLKPAELTPLSAIRLVALLAEAGLPRDWVTVLTGSGSVVGQALVCHPVPALVTFTGSTGVGWSIAAAAPTKRVCLELGSTAPLIVEPDTDLALIARRVAVAGYSHAGQSCISTQRLLLADPVHDEFVDHLEREARRLVLGDPLDDRTDVGPLITRQSAERVVEWIDEAVDTGAELRSGGRRTGSMIEPAVLTGVSCQSRIWTQEVFGPVLAVMRYDNFATALTLANDTGLALHAAVWTPRLDRAMEAVRTLDFGGVLINDVPTFRADQQPYGGVKEAGNTREGPAYTVREMTREKFVMFAG